MAVRYVRSTDGSDADNGTTWALAKASLTGVAAIDTAGDTLWVSQAHAESTAGALSIALAGTGTSPTRVICGNDAASPPTALATTASVTTTGANNITYAAAGTAHYTYGISFNAGTGATAASLVSRGDAIFESCNFSLVNTGSTGRIQGGENQVFRNCGFKFGASGQGFSTNGGLMRFVGGSLLSGGTSPAALVVAGGGQFVFDGFDLTNASSSINLIGTNSTATNITFRDCRLPASWSGSLSSATPGMGSRYELFNCDSADTNYRYQLAMYRGTVRDETTLVRTGGASDGTTPYSLKAVSNTNAVYPGTLDLPEIVTWNSAVGSSMTATVEILRDSATALKDDEIWMEVMYLGTSGVPLASFAADSVASVVATSANQDTSSATWTTTGMSNPNTQKLVVTFTPQEAGFLHAVVKVAKASATVYVDPKLTVT